MGGLRLLAGEKEELRLLPHPAGWWPHYLGAAWFGVVGLALFLLASTPAWSAHASSLDAPERDAARFWEPLWATPYALALYATVLLVAGGYVQRMRRGRNDHLALSCVVAVAIAAVAAFAVPALAADAQGANPASHLEQARTAAWLVPLSLAGACLLGFAWAETRRLTTRYHITNVRTVGRTAIPPREHALHHADLADIDQRRAGAGRVRHLVLVPRNGEAVALRGVAKPTEVAALIALLAQRATATDYLRKTQEIDARILDAVAAFHRRS